MYRKLSGPLGIALVALLGLTACGDESGGEVSSGDDAATEDTSADSGAEDNDEEGGGSQESAGPTFGDTWTYDDGLAVTIGAPEEFNPGEFASGGEAFEHHVRFDVTVENGTGADFDPNLISITAHSSGAEGEAVFDSDSNLDGPPMTTLMDGQDVTFPFGFGVNDPADISVEFSDLGSEEILRDPVIFVSE